MEEAAGVRNADAITQTHRMTLDEAHLILNAKKGDPVDVVIKVRCICGMNEAAPKLTSGRDATQNYEHLFKINSPPEAPTPSASSSSASASASSTPSSSGGRRPPPTTLRFHSHYLQSKIVRARERIEAELKILQEAEDAKRMGYTKPEAELPPSSESSRTPPPPPPS